MPAAREQGGENAGPAFADLGVAGPICESLADDVVAGQRDGQG